MADWKRLARTLILADGSIGQREAEIVRKEFLIDKTISKPEAEFLLDLRRSATRAVPDFHEFVLKMVSKILLADGDLTQAEVTWLKQFIFGDGQVDEFEKEFLRELRDKAKSSDGSFTTFCRQILGN